MNLFKRRALKPEIKAEASKIKTRESLKYRISLAAGLTIFLAVIITSGIVSWEGFKREVGNEVKLLQGTAKVFSANISKPLVEKDYRQVQRILASIGKFPQFKFASVRLPDGEVFAELGYEAVLQRNNVALGSDEPFDLLFHSTIWVQDRIIDGGEVVGYLHLLSDVSEVKSEHVNSLVYNLLLAFLSAMIAIVFSRIFVSRITDPIRNLSLLMARAGEGGDLSIRAPAHRRGEISLLSQSFNRMLEDTEKRNRELLEYQQTLEQKVKDRTERLNIAKEEAVSASIAKSEFLATMSHEIRTPMNGMLVMAELLTTADISPKYRGYADIIMKSGNSLLTIINDVLDFSKIESGQLDLETIPVQTRVLFEEVVTLFWQTAAQKGLDLACQVDPDVPEVFSGDPSRIKQVLVNLTNNALKFTDQGEVFIKVSASEKKDGSRELNISVIDTGIGIPEDKLDKVFESFTQAEQSTTRRFGGTGLGLPICQQLVEAMNGSISVKSTMGNGTIFMFNLPIEEALSQHSDFELKNQKALLLLPERATSRVLYQGLSSLGIETVRMDASSLSGKKLDEYDYIFTSMQNLELIDTSDPSKYRVALAEMGDLNVDDLIESEKIHDLIEYPLTSYAVRDVAKRLLNGKPRGKDLTQHNSSSISKLVSYSSAKVLVADDSAVNREVIIQALSRFDIAPKVVENGLQALNEFYVDDYDLIFMDCSMPVMDGFEATRKLRLKELELSKKKIPIIALTAHADEIMAEKSIASGMDAVLVKPFTLHALASCLDEWLKAYAIAGGSKSSQSEGQNGVKSEIAHLKPKQETTYEAPETEFDQTALSGLNEVLGTSFDECFGRLLRLYVSHAPATFEKLKNACESKDLEEIASSAHALKSMSGNIGATNLSKLLGEMEAHAKADEISQAVSMQPNVTMSYRNLVKEAKLMLAEYPEEQAGELEIA